MPIHSKNNRSAMRRQVYRRTLAFLAFCAVLLFVAAGVLYFTRGKNAPVPSSSDSTLSGLAGQSGDSSLPSSSDSTLSGPAGQSGNTSLPSSGSEGAVSGASASSSSSVDKTAWNLILANASHPIAEQDIELAAVDNAGHQLDARAAGALKQMIADGNAQGLSLMVCSAYRSVAYQTTLYNKQVQIWLNQGYSDADARATAATIVAAPGTSEHNTGLAADIVSVHYQVLDNGFEDTPEFAWLYAHCAEYGFVLRYPADKTAVTGVIYEPWHYRYVGKEAAREIMDAGICLEEYLGEA